MLELFSLKDKTAIVTGACGLLGTKHAEALAGAGANVILCDINEKACKEKAASIRGNHLGVLLDVTRPETIKTARDLILKEFKHIDVLVNNAGISDSFENPIMAGEQSKFENYPLDMWDLSWKVNVSGVFLCAQIFGTPMAEQGSGSIINIGSTYGIVGPDQSIYKDKNGKHSFYKSPSYPATKGAVINFTRYLAAYWGNKGVRVNTLSPGGVENNQDDYFVENYTQKTLLGRMATPADYQGALIFLASQASSYMTGANLVVDGGWTAI
jgi:NAD(P)-dependent dehydrogenase (short-subunit alcohol dehydrogenase family)